MNKLIVRIPRDKRDTDGIRIDRMLAGIGANVERELPRTTPRWVDLLVEHTSAPEGVRGQVVVPVYDEIDGELSFDRWQVWTPELEAETGAGKP